MTDHILGQMDAFKHEPMALLNVEGHKPVQIRIDDPGRYEHLLAQLCNYEVDEVPQPDASLPILSLDQMETEFGIKSPPTEE